MVVKEYGMKLRGANPGQGALTVTGGVGRR